MKKKIVTTKLFLKKKIISLLSVEKSNQVVGGGTVKDLSCNVTCQAPTTTQTIRVSECGPVTCQAGCTTIPGTEAC